MALQLRSPAWKVRSVKPSRGSTGDRAIGLPGSPPEFLSEGSRVSEEVILEPTAARTRGQDAASASLDITCEVKPGHTAILALRFPSGALTFHRPVQSTSRGLRGPSQLRFQVRAPQAPSRGLIDQAIKAMVVEVVQVAADKAASFVLPRLAEALEKAVWKQRGLAEGWVRVTRDTLAAGALAQAKPVSPERSLLLIHGTFSNAAAAYHDLAASDFFERIKDSYADRVFAFNHFSVSRTPEQNARMLLEALPEQTTTFDVVTHSRGGLVLRTLVERGRSVWRSLASLQARSRGAGGVTERRNAARHAETLGRDDRLDREPARIVSGQPVHDRRGVCRPRHQLAGQSCVGGSSRSAIDGRGEQSRLPRSRASPLRLPTPTRRWWPTTSQPAETLQRLLDMGIDGFFASANDLVVPSEGGWRIDRSGATLIPATRIGCFGPGGNLPGAVTHVNFFSRAETATFLVNALGGRLQSLDRVDPRKSLPTRRLLRGVITDPTLARPARKGLAAAARESARAIAPRLWKNRCGSP